MVKIVRANNYLLLVATYLIFCLFGLSGLSSTAHAKSNPYLVKDINVSQSQSNSVPSGFTASGGNIFFVANDGTRGLQFKQLWKTDGTPGGTTMVKEINPAGDPYISNMTDVTGILFFTATDGTHNNLNGYALWKSDGTAGGTIMLKASYAHSLINVNGTLFFSTYDPVNGSGLWKSDGTPEGTVIIKHPSSYDGYPLGPLTNVNGILFFSAYDDLHGNEFWRSDGTPEGTVMVADISPGLTSSNPQNLINADGTLFFTAYDPISGCAVWKSDGSPEGTLLVKAMCANSLISLNGTVLLVVNDVATNQLWRSDGTPEGTIMIKDFGAMGFPYLFDQAAVEGTLFFTLSGINGDELWKSDGTSDGTVIVKITHPEGISIIQDLTDANGTLFFTSGEGGWNELWKSDGTPGGTVLVRTTNPEGNSVIRGISNVNGTLFFSADDGVHGAELWKSDGTQDGTVMVKDINRTNSGSAPSELVGVDNTLFFAANDGSHGRQLWRSDGTESGTFMVKETNHSEKFYYPGDLTNVNGKLFFTAADGSYTGELWVSDGTPQGTNMLQGFSPTDPFVSDPFIGYFAAANGTLFFPADDGVHGMELWKSDGTPEGTVLVKDINPNGHSWPIQLTAVNGTVFFTTAYYNNNNSLWKSDGSESGTLMVKEFPSFLSHGIDNLLNANGTLFFIRSTSLDVELWESDGTTTGTVMLKTLNELPIQFATVNNTLFYIEGGAFACELWKSDGTQAGTVLVKDMCLEGAYNPVLLSSLNGLLLFTTTTPAQYGRSLWKSDGTLQGTVRIKDSIPSGVIGEPTIVLASLYFLNSYWANDCSFHELWRSDGTSTGTVMIYSYCDDGSGQLANAGDTLFFTGSDPIHGQELWAYAPPPNPPIVSGKTPTNNTKPTWTWLSGWGGGNGTYRYQLDTESGIWTQTTMLSYTPGVPLSNGAHTLYVQEQNNSGDWSGSGSKVIVVDVTPPAGSITINGGAKATRNIMVTLAIHADDLSTVRKMCISNTPTCTSWVTYVATKNWTLTTGNGTKTVNVWFKDQFGYANKIPFSDSIILDTKAPTNGSLTAVAGAQQVRLNWKGFSDPLSGIANYKLVFSNTSTTSCSSSKLIGTFDSTTTTYTHTGLTSGKIYYYRVCAVDSAGNMSLGATASAKPQ